MPEAGQGEEVRRAAKEVFLNKNRRPDDGAAVFYGDAPVQGLLAFAPGLLQNES